MPHHLGVEDIEPGHWVAFALDLPGCYSSGPTADEAAAGAPACISAYVAWRIQHGYPLALAEADTDVEIAGVFHSFRTSGGYIVNAFFEDDRRPLLLQEVQDALQLLDYSRHDLLAVIEQIPSQILDQPIANEVQGSIAGILGHIAGAERWYLESLGAVAERSRMPEDQLDRLEWVRAEMRAQLPRLVGCAALVDRTGESWSTRKVVRRMLWHERDHTQPIQRITGIPARRIC